MAATTATPTMPWESFARGRWNDHIDVRDVIQRNFTPYERDGDSLAGPVPRRELVQSVQAWFAAALGAR
jgi:formate C-acetyltransferase